MKKNIYIIGVGLIGGSFAYQLRKLFPVAKFIGIDKSTYNLKESKRLNIIDESAKINSIVSPYIIILATPVKSIISLLPEILNRVDTDSLVIDFGSTKKSICRSVESHKNRGNFLAAHPIAGTEYSGPVAANAKLFIGKNIILCETDKTNKNILIFANQIFLKLRMIVSYMNPENHDKHIAFVSHLSHLSSFMLGKTVIDKEKNEKNIFDMAGSGFESTVRLAKSSPEMWVDIFEDNKLNVLKSLNHYIENLELMKNMIEKNKFNELKKTLKSINHIKTILKDIK